MKYDGNTHKIRYNNDDIDENNDYENVMNQYSDNDVAGNPFDNDIA